MTHSLISPARIYGPDFSPKLVANAAQRLIAEDLPPIIPIYGTDETQMQLAHDALSDYGLVVDHLADNSIFINARSTARPVFLKINPANDIWNFVAEMPTYHGEQNLGHVLSAIKPSAATPSVTIDLDASQIVGPESLPWDGGVRSFPVHPIKRQRNITQHMLLVNAPAIRSTARRAAANMVRKALAAAPGSLESPQGQIKTITQSQGHLTYVPWTMGLEDFATMVKLAEQGLELPTLGDSTIEFSAAHDGQLDALRSAQA